MFGIMPQPKAHIIQISGVLPNGFSYGVVCSGLGFGLVGLYDRRGAYYYMADIEAMVVHWGHMVSIVVYDGEEREILNQW